MESFTVKTTIAREDWLALLRAVQSRVADQANRDGNLLIRALPVIVWLAAVALIALLCQRFPGMFRLEAMLVWFGLFISMVWLTAWRQRRGFRPDDNGAFLGTTEFVFDRDGFQVTRANSRGRNDWSMLREVTHSPTHIFLWIDRISAYTLRVADLPAPLTADEAVASIRAFASAWVPGTAAPGAEAANLPATPAANPAATPLPAPPPAVQSQAERVPSIGQELMALLKLEVHRPVEAAHLFGRDLTLFILAMLGVGVWAGLDRLNYTGDVDFFWYGLSSMSTLAFASLLLAWVLSRLSYPRLPLRRTLLLILAISPVVTFATWAAPQLGTVMTYVVVVGGVAWVAFFVHSGLRVMTGSRQGRAIGAAGICFMLLFAGFERLHLAPDIWYAPDPDHEQSAEKDAQREQLLFEQASRIDAEISKLAPGDAQRPSIYFVGFAGFGGQRVFAKEIGTAARTVGARYAADDRKLLLVNDRRDEEKYPLATVSALRHALLGLGRRMDTEKDVLFLALSSHGSADGTISVANESMLFWRDLSATDLRAMLDESGIRWRIIVVSACHAGSFIEALADERTIVLTAAAKENTSFGCSDDRDLTYFGEAFYRDALLEATSLRAAFDRARAAISERERNEGIDPSDPQAHYGAELEKKLEELAPATGAHSTTAARSHP